MRRHGSVSESAHLPSIMTQVSIMNTVHTQGRARSRTACADSSAMGAWQMMAVGRCAAWKCSRIRPRSLSSFRSSNGAWPAATPLHHDLACYLCTGRRFQRLMFHIPSVCQ